MPSKVRILDPPHQQERPLNCDNRSGPSSGSDDWCPRGAPLCSVGHCCIWHGFGTGGGWWARPTRPRSLIPGRLCVGSPGSRVALAPSRQRRRRAAPLVPVSRRRTIPGTPERTEIPCEHFCANADRRCGGSLASVAGCRCSGARCPRESARGHWSCHSLLTAR